MQNGDLSDAPAGETADAPAGKKKKKKKKKDGETETTATVLKRIATLLKYPDTNTGWDFRIGIYFFWRPIGKQCREFQKLRK